MKKLFVFILTLTLCVTICPSLRAQHDTSSVPWRAREVQLVRMELLAPVLLPSTADKDLAATLTTCRYSREQALHSINRYLRAYPQDSHRDELNLYKGALYLYQGDYNRARHALENVDEKALTGDALAERKVRLAFSLIKTQRTTSSLVSLFESAAKSNGYWGKVARLYLAGEFLAEGRIGEARSLYNELQGDNRFTTDATIGYLATLYYEGDYNKVCTEAGRLQQSNKELISSPLFLQIMANSQYRLGNSLKSIAFFTPLFSKESTITTDEDRLIYGAALIEEKQYDRAQAVLRPATKATKPTGEVATLYLSRALREGGLYSQAITSYESIATPTTTSSIREVAMYEMTLVMRATKQSNFGQDVRIVEQFLNDFPKSVHRSTMEQFLVEFYLSNTDYNFSWQSLQRVSKKTDPIKEAEQFVANRRLWKALQNDHLSEAETLLRQALALPRVSTKYYGESLLLASELYEKQNHMQQASKALLDFTKLPSSANATNLPEVYYRLGYIAFNRKQFKSALSSFNKYLSHSGAVSNRRKSDAYSRLGDCYFALGNLSEAIIAYDLSNRSADATEAYALLRKAEILGIRKQYADQIATLRSIIANVQDNAYARKAYLNVGAAYLMAGEVSKAESTYNETIRKYPHFEEGREASLRLALLYFNTNRSNQAIQEYQNLINRAPDSQEAQQAFDNLKSISREEGRMDILQGAIQNSNGHFKLSEGETRNLAFDIAHKAYAQKSPEAETQLLAFIKSYPSGADANEARLLLATLYLQQGNAEKAYSIYETVALQASQLSAKQRLVMYEKMASIEVSKKQFNKAFSHYRQAFQEETLEEKKLYFAQKALHVALLGRNTQDGLPFANEVLTAHAKANTSSIRLLRGRLLQEKGSYEEALKDFSEVSKTFQTAEGAEALVDEASILIYQKKNLSLAKKRLNQFVEEGTPQEYWLARGYILLAELYAVEGDNVTAEGYLNSLQKNYPQREDDIHLLITQALKRISAKK